MTNIDDLARRQSLDIDPVEAAEELTAILDLESAGVKVRSARIVGRGTNATADLYLSDGTAVFFERIRDFATPARLMAEIAICTGATPRIKLPQAMRALALLRSIATHNKSVDVDDISIDWGISFLQSAAVRDVDMNDQLQRWQAFCELEKLDAQMGTAPVGAAGMVVLRHVESDTRYVRTGWFKAFVRQEDGSVSPQQIRQRMERVGWQKRGSTGRIKASCPGRPQELAWSFYVVPKDWEKSQ